MQKPYKGTHASAASRDEHVSRQDVHSDKKAKPPRSRRSKVFLAIGLALIAVALVLLGFIAYDYINGRLRYSSVRDASEIDESAIADIFNGNLGLEYLNLDWDALRAINPDTVGWIYIEGTSIDYPMVQGDDNEYYLTHIFDGSYSKVGTVFLDYENSPSMSSGNNLIYGHNMLDGSMFADITLFKDQSFLEQNNSIIIATPEQNYMLAPAFTYIANGDEKIRKTDFSSLADLHLYVQDLYSRAVTTSLVDIDKIDKLYSLVTCSYEDYDVRTVLCAVERQAVTPVS